MLQQLLQQALNLHQQGQLHQAALLYDQVLKLKPRQADALHHRGVLALQCGQIEEGIAHINKAIKQAPALPQPHLNLGNALVMAGRRTEAIACFDKAIALAPRYAQAHTNKANTLQELSRLTEALQSIDMALSIDSQQAQAHAIRGNVLRAMHRPAEALLAYERALELQPEDIDCQMNRAATLALLGRAAEAETAYRFVLGLQPSLTTAHSDLGLVLQESGRHLEALEAIDHAIRLQPEYITAHVNRGVTLQQLGRIPEAMLSFREALRLSPQHLQARSNLMFTMTQSAKVDAADYAKEARAYGDSVQALVTEPLSAHRRQRGSELSSPLRLGLVSGDFNAHPVGLFLGNLLRHLDPAQIEVHAYATQALEDDITAMLRSSCQQWRTVHTLTDRALAEQIVEDGIDVLIDLSGHTTGHRLPMFAWRPAPLQLSWLGYLASTGVNQIDHVLTDAVSAPLQLQPMFVEGIAHLPESNNCYTPPEDWQSLVVAPPPMQRLGHATFGCFQSLSKITDGALATWAQILAQVEGAHLLIQNRQMTDESLRLLLLNRLRATGIDTNRVQLRAGAADRRAYLASHADVDIMLDTFPYPGITTTCEALFMGVPTVALNGASMLSRQGGALLSAAGLPEWSSQSPDQYVDIAVRQASDVNALARLRQTLRAQVMSTSLFDGERFARQFSETLLRLWAQNHPAC